LIPDRSRPRRFGAFIVSTTRFLDPGQEPENFAESGISATKIPILETLLRIDQQPQAQTWPALYSM
jgi:hypothetical protein